jgi:hypothetical protein
MIPGAWLSSLKLQMIDKSIVCWEVNINKIIKNKIKHISKITLKAIKQCSVNFYLFYQTVG